jgi:hypothetical protein
MFAAGSIKASKWGWDIKQYPLLYGETITQPSTVGYFSGGCLAPNGLIYVMPSVRGFQGVIVIKPGKSNSKTGKWEPATITNVPAEVINPNSKKPALPDIVETQGSLQRRFQSRGILAPNGLIYFFGFFADGYVVVRPQDNPNDNITAYTEWKVVTYTSVGLNPGANTTFGYYGGFLHTDGKIYLLPSLQSVRGTRAPIARIVPRTTYLTSDTIETSGYWTGSLSPNRRYMVSVESNSFTVPGDQSGSAITPPADTSLPAIDYSVDLLPIGDAISHPNGNIYIYGGYKNPYILKLNTTNWSNTSTLGRSIFHTSNDLRIPNISPTTYGIKGSFFAGALEKLKEGQNPEDLKIYLTYSGSPNISGGGSVSSDFAKTIVFDPNTETFENIGDSVATTGGQVGFNMLPPIKMANGNIFCLSRPSPTAGTNPFGQLITTGDDNDYKVIGPQTKRSILSSNEVQSLRSNNFETGMIVCNMADHALYGASLGKTFITAAQGCFEITSVKGFYPGIKYFNYTSSNDSQVYEIPSDLSSLPTSLWNAYFNKPR